MTAYATAADVAAGWRPLTADEQAVATVLLARATALINAQVPSVPARITAGTLDPEVPRTVSVNMVQRVLRNPSGVAQQSLGPASVSYGRGDTGGLILTADDLAALAPGTDATATGAASVGAGSVAMAVWDKTNPGPPQDWWTRPHPTAWP